MVADVRATLQAMQKTQDCTFALAMLIVREHSSTVVRNAGCHVNRNRGFWFASFCMLTRLPLPQE